MAPISSTLFITLLSIGSFFHCCRCSNLPVFNDMKFHPFYALPDGYRATSLVGRSLLPLITVLGAYTSTYSPNDIDVISLYVGCDWQVINVFGLKVFDSLVIPTSLFRLFITNNTHPMIMFLGYFEYGK